MGAAWPPRYTGVIGMNTRVVGGQKADAFLKRLQRVPRTPITLGVGIHNRRNRKGESLAAIAYVQEYGSRTNRIPSRPFMRVSLEKFRMRSLGYKAMPYKMDYRNVRTSLKRSMRAKAIEFKKIMKQEIKSMSVPPNAPSTVRRKGFDNPLIRHKDLLNAIEWKWMKLTEGSFGTF